MKRILSLVVIICFILTCLVGCDFISSQGTNSSELGSLQGSSDVLSNNRGSEGNESQTSQTTSSTENNSSESFSGESTSSPSIPVTPPPTSSETVTPGPADNDDVVVDDNINIDFETPKVDEEVKVETHHTPLAKSEYYQLSTLTATEKSLYNAIISAIENSQNVINVETYNLSYNAVQTVLQKTMADNPQFFWVAKTTSIYYSNSGGQQKPLYIVLYYTDGITKDVISSDFELTTTADRDKIKSQIATFNNMLEQAINTIPVNATETEKENAIFRYVAKHVEYDYSAAGKIYTSNDVIPHAFDIYGALCEGKSVCEGYAKLFQYMCYCVGINATQIVGLGDGGGHMWNAVKIDGKWYQSDPTWSSYSNSDDIYEEFMLLEKDDMLDANRIPKHELTDSCLSIP